MFIFLYITIANCFNAFLYSIFPNDNMVIYTFLFKTEFATIELYTCI